MPEPCCPWCHTPVSAHGHMGGSLDCLNAWVAQVVLGCDVFRTDVLGFSCGCKSARGHHPPPHGWTEFHDGLADFSGNIAAAWQVVESFSEDTDGQGGYNVQLDGHGSGWTFHIFKDGTCYEATAPTPMLAICKVAIRSLLGSEEKPLSSDVARERGRKGALAKYAALRACLSAQDTGVPETEGLVVTADPEARWGGRVIWTRCQGQAREEQP